MCQYFNAKYCSSFPFINHTLNFILSKQNARLLRNAVSVRLSSTYRKRAIKQSWKQSEGSLWWAKELSQTFGWPSDVNTVQASSLWSWECIFFPCFLEVFITCFLILPLMRYPADTLLFYFQILYYRVHVHSLPYLDGENRVFGINYSQF